MNDIYMVRVDDSYKYSIFITVAEPPTIEQRDLLLSDVRQAYTELGGNSEFISLALKRGDSMKSEVEQEDPQDFWEGHKYLFIVTFPPSDLAPTDDELQMIADELCSFYGLNSADDIRIVSVEGMQVVISERPSPEYSKRMLAVW